MKTLRWFALVALAGCYIQTRYAPPPPDPNDDVRDVIGQEYYCMSEDDLAMAYQYRYYHGFADCDMWFMYHCGFWLGWSFPVVVTNFQACGCNMQTFATRFSVPPSAFVVQTSGVGTCPPVYARFYGPGASGTFVGVSNAEFRALVDLKIACNYYGHTPQTFFAACRPGEPPCNVLIRDRGRMGQGGMDCKGNPIHRTKRPWEMGEKEREGWEKHRQASMSSAQARFDDSHPDSRNAHSRSRSRRDLGGERAGFTSEGDSSVSEHGRSGDSGGHSGGSGRGGIRK